MTTYQKRLVVLTVLGTIVTANAALLWQFWNVGRATAAPLVDDVATESVVSAVDCDDVSACGIQDEDDCLWRIFQQQCVDDFDSLDPVEQRLCELNIVLDGELTELGGAECWYDAGASPPFSGNESFFRGDPAVGHIDRVGSLDIDPGPNGIDEPPLAQGLPSGFNIGCSVLWFEPDHDATDGEDSSFLYVAWDVADPINPLLDPVPYDADGNGSACQSDLPAVTDLDDEFYKVSLRGCADLTVYDPESRVTNDVLADPNVVVEMSLEELPGQEKPLDTFVLGLETLAFPTADGVTNPGNACIDNEREFCANGNNVEMVIKAVETCGYFGPNASPVEADSYEAWENRIALTQLVGLLRADTDADNSSEESAVVALRASIPEIEVTKFVRCADTDDPFVGSLDALPDAEVEFKITITNFGNENLAVTVTDVMEAIGTQAGHVTFEPVCETLEAELTSPRRGLVNYVVTFANAADPPVCADPGAPECLKPPFFYPSCDPPSFVEGVSFLEAVSTGGSAFMGTLLGVEAQQTDGVCEIIAGDTMVLRFRAILGADEGFCDEWDDPDFRNGVTVTGTLVGESEIVAEDEADVIDTDREEQAGEDDNVVTVDLLCNALECEKEVCADLNNDGDCDDAEDLGFTSDLALPCDVTFPIQLIHRIETFNTGETRLENINVCDDGDCQSCSPLNPGGCCVVEFVVPVPDRAAWDALATGDDDANPDCYTNEGIATGEVDTSGICAPDGTIEVESLPCTARTCMGDCDITVEKRFRCIDNCTNRSVIEDPTLEATPGAALEFVIDVTNVGDEPICALRYSDTLTGSFDPCSEPFCVVELIDGVDGTVTECTVPPDWFKTDGTPFELILVEACGVLMAPNDRVEVRCAGTIPEGASGQIVNIVDVECAPDDGDNCVTGAVYCRGESAQATVDIKPCSMDVMKDVTCDDPRDPGAVFEPDSVDALPGSTVGFRIRICNTGEVNLTSVDIDDNLDCSAWFVPNSVVATINGDDVTDCICTDPVGVCDSIDDINDRKDLDPCHAGGIGPGECLTITFEVIVPPDFDVTGTDIDCANTVTVEGFTDVCSSPTANPCGEDSDDADIDVLVPEITCDKLVCADLDNDGDCEDEGDFDFTNNLELVNGVTPPFTLIYRIDVTNPGEAALANVEACDLELLSDAVVSGLTPGPCELDPGTGCKNLGTLAAGASGSAVCQFIVPDRAAWNAFAESDGDENTECYENNAVVTAQASDSTICTRGADADVDSGCSAAVCLHPDECDITVAKEACILPPPPDEGEGCTPGFWKNHLSAWPDGLQPGDVFNTVFGVDVFGQNITLLHALNLGGGGTHALGRHATAALLNATSDAVDYGLSANEVIAAVQEALAEDGDVEATKNYLESFNEEGCPIGQGSSATNTATGEPVPDCLPAIPCDVPTEVEFTYTVCNVGDCAVRVILIDDVFGDVTPAPPADILDTNECADVVIVRVLSEEVTNTVTATAYYVETVEECDRETATLTVADDCNGDGDGEGCTPGFWKNHPDAWPSSYQAGDDFDTVFGVNAFDPDVTLFRALNLGGGGIHALARHATAALLNAASSGVDYEMSEEEIINLVQAALAPGGNIESAKNDLEGLNEQGCPLGGREKTGRASGLHRSLGR